jgi:hypothetical protein
VGNQALPLYVGHAAPVLSRQMLPAAQNWQLGRAAHAAALTLLARQLTLAHSDLRVTQPQPHTSHTKMKGTGRLQEHHGAEGRVCVWGGGGAMLGDAFVRATHRNHAKLLAVLHAVVDAEL